MADVWFDRCLRLKLSRGSFRANEATVLNWDEIVRNTIKILTRSFSLLSLIVIVCQRLIISKFNQSSLVISQYSP